MARPGGEPRIEVGRGAGPRADRFRIGTLKPLEMSDTSYIVGGDDGYGLKPGPRMLVKIIEELKVAKDRAVLMVDHANKRGALNGTARRATGCPDEISGREMAQPSPDIA